MPARTAIVTGAGSGLGAAIAERLAAEGYRVAVLDFNAEAARLTAARIGAASLAADVSDEASVDAAVAEAVAAFGAAPDLLVNNAGIVRFGPLLEQSVADFRRVVEVNLMGCYIVTRAVARHMVARGSGCVINITSINAITPGPNAGAYPATKAAVASLTEHFAVELGKHGIRVNSIAPGFIDAGMSAPIFADPKVRALRGSGVPLGGLGTAEDVANAVVFLASDAARYINAHQLVVDGGVVANLLALLPREKQGG